MTQDRIDFIYEYRLKEHLFNESKKESKKSNIDGSICFGEGPITDEYFKQWWRIFVLEHVYGLPQDPINDTDYVIPDYIMNGSTEITELQFKIDSKGYFPDDIN